MWFLRINNSVVTLIRLAWCKWDHRCGVGCPTEAFSSHPGVDHGIQLPLHGGPASWVSPPTTTAMMSSLCTSTGCDCHIWMWWLVYVRTCTCQCLHEPISLTQSWFCMLYTNIAYGAVFTATMGTECVILWSRQVIRHGVYGSLLVTEKWLNTHWL